MEQICDYAMRLMKNKAMFRGQIDEKLDQMVRAIVVLKRSTLADAAQEALEEWVKRPENQKIVEKYNLLD